MIYNDPPDTQNLDEINWDFDVNENVPHPEIISDDDIPDNYVELDLPDEGA